MFHLHSRREQLRQEMAQHLEMEVQANIEAGMAPDQARDAARKKFGNVLHAMEDSRMVWGGVRIESWLQDFRYALRTLGNAKGYTAALVLTLALGLGSVAAMLAVVDSVLLRPALLPRSEQLMIPYGASISVQGTHGSAPSLRYVFPYKQIDQLQEGTRDTFAGWGGYNVLVQPVETKAGARVTLTVVVTPGLFPTIGVTAGKGSLFSSQDATNSTVVVNDAFWRERLGADPKVLGSSIRVGGQSRTVVGVLPTGARFPQNSAAPAIYLPVSLNAEGADQFKYDLALLIGRLKPGVATARALQNVRAVAAHFDPLKDGERPVLHLQPYGEYITGDVRTPLYGLLGAVAVLLLIASANAVNLQIARAVQRFPEVLIRSALGARFGRLLQQLVAENVLISTVSAFLACCVAYGTTAWIRRAYGDKFTRFDEVNVQPEVAAMLTLVAVVIAVAIATLLAWKVHRQSQTAFAQRTVSRPSRLPSLLVALQVCLTCVLLAVCGLFLRTFQRLQNVELGFNTRDVTTLVLMPGNQQQDPEVSKQAETRLLNAFEHLPGVRSATIQTALPFSNYAVSLRGETEVTGRAYQKGDDAQYSMVSTNFVAASGIRLLRGRPFALADENGEILRVLVNRAFADKYFQAHNPVGEIVHFHNDPADAGDPLFRRPLSVVGVVENELQGGDLGSPYQPMVYLNYRQIPRGAMLSMVFNASAQFAIRSALKADVLASELRSAIQTTAPGMVEMHLSSMEEDVAQSLMQRRLTLRLVAGFGLIALILSAVGIYGVLAHSVALRRREIGVRLALGCSRPGAVRFVARQAAEMVLAGLIPGLAGAWAAAHAVRSMLFGVNVLDPVTLIGTAAVILLASAFASFGPALHTEMIDPASILRSE